VGYLTPDGGVTTFLHGKTSDPYFGMSVVVWAQAFGLNATEVGERVIDHGLKTLRADGLFDKECEAAAGHWVSCWQADSEDATLAKWVEVLYVQARARGARRLPPAWQASAARALRALDRQELPSGIFSVFPPEDVAYAGYALYLDNLDVAQVFQTISQVFSRFCERVACAARLRCSRSSTRGCSPPSSGSSERPPLSEAVHAAGGAIAKNATAQAVAATAAASGIGEPLAMVIEGAVVVMNADQAATVIQSGYQLAKMGLSSSGREVIEESVNIMKQGLDNSLNETNTAARQRLKEFDIK